MDAVVMDRRYAVLLLQSLQLAHLVVAAPPGETRQYCHNDVFRAECSSGHVILVTSALYGRMSLGRCVKTDFGFIGCKVDVIDHVHRRCSGRRVCNVRVPDSTLDRAKPCNEDLKSYLQVAYSCVQVAEPDALDGCILKANNDDDDEGPLVGYLAGKSGRHGRHACGSERSPWLVTAQRGQRVRFTLMDFSSTADELDVHHVTDDVVQSQKTARQDNDVSRQQQRLFGSCPRLFATVFDLATNRTAKICGGSDVTVTSHTYTTHGHRAAVVVHASSRSGSRSAVAGDSPLLEYFLIRCETVGCADFAPAGGADVWTQRFGARMQLGCVTSPLRWQMFCVNGRWQGSTNNCTLSDMNSADTPPSHRLHRLSVAAVVIVLVTLIIALLVSTLGIFCMHRSWRAQMARDASLARLKQFDCKFVDYSLSLTDVARNAANDRGRSVQSRSYDVMYCTTKPRHSEAGCKSMHDLRGFNGDVQDHVTTDHVLDGGSWLSTQPYHACTLPHGDANNRVRAHAASTRQRMDHRCVCASPTEYQLNNAS